MIPVLRQSATAPKLETYQLSFWAHGDRESAVSVRYLPAAGQSVGDPFLSFTVPKNALVAGAGGVPLNQTDSVLVTLAIDSVAFAVDFQPSGVQFAPQVPAQLVIWYGNANMDLDGNGNVNGNDRNLLDQLAFFYLLPGSSSWLKQLSKNDPTNTLIGAELTHFSEWDVAF